jgi:uncharacterized protein (TIGR03083 family)
MLRLRKVGGGGVAYEWIIDALDQTWNSIDRLLRTQSAEAFDAPTACPGWSVRDVVSHLLGFEVMLRGGPVPEFKGQWPDYVRNPIGEINEAFVAAHRSEPGVVVLDQFKAAADRSLAALRALDDEQWEKVGWSPEGDRPYHRFQETRVVDSWIHLQDIRDALLQPEDDHGPGEEVVVNRFEAGLPYVVGKRMRPPEGTVIQVNLSGRLARMAMIQVIEGRATPVAQASRPADLEITTPVALFWRRAAGRIGAEAFLNASATDVRGDRDLARSFAESLVIMI